VRIVARIVVRIVTRNAVIMFWPPDRHRRGTGGAPSVPA